MTELAPEPLPRARGLLKQARPLTPALALLAGVRCAELLVLPLLVLVPREKLAWLLVLALGLAARALGLLLHQHARRRVRAGFMAHAALDSLRVSAPSAAGADAAFWGAHISEHAFCIDIPALVGALIAVCVVVPMAAAELGGGAVATIAGLLGAAILVDLLASRRRRTLVNAVVECRHQTAIWMAAAMQDVGEMSSGRATGAFLTSVSERVGQWSRAEDALERRRTLERAFTLLGALALLLLLSETAGLSRVFSQTPNPDAMGGLLLLGALLPAAYSLSQHLESLLVAQSEIARLLDHRGPRRVPGTQRLLHAPAELTASDLVVRYGQQLALNVPSLRLDLTRPVVVTGPNGAGKTTFAKLVSGLMVASHGSLSIDDQAPSHLSADDLAYVPQNPVLVEPLSVLLNLRLVAPDCTREEAGAVLAALGAPRLDSILDEPVASLSRGEGRRIATARALLSPARLLVLDEPDAWLDAHGRRLLAQVLQARAERSAIILVSHRLDLIEQFEQIVVLSAEHALEAVGDCSTLATSSQVFRELRRSEMSQPTA